MQDISNISREGLKDLRERAEVDGILQGLKSGPFGSLKKGEVARCLAGMRDSSRRAEEELRKELDEARHEAALAAASLSEEKEKGSELARKNAELEARVRRLDSEREDTRALAAEKERLAAELAAAREILARETERADYEAAARLEHEKKQEHYKARLDEAVKELAESAERTAAAENIFAAKKAAFSGRSGELAARHRKFVRLASGSLADMQSAAKSLRENMESIVVSFEEGAAELASILEDEKHSAS